MVCLHSNETIVSSNHVVNMPELPEVEVTRMGIAPHIEGRTVRQMVVRQPQLRWLIDANLPEWLKNAQIERTERRSKYLIVHCACTQGRRGVLLIHLGMSGSLRIVAKGTPPQKHDHVDWVFDDHILRYHDPRRFGSILWYELTDEQPDWRAHPRLQALGMEPFDPEFNGEYIYRITRSMTQAIKVALMTGKWVVGVGNIYASEVLFLCGIHPQTPAKQLTRAQCDQLAEHIPLLLQRAIEQGGSTLKDFVNSDGTNGYFQMSFNVYDQTDRACIRCKNPIERIVQAQRATYFCPKCQSFPRKRSSRQ